MIKTKETRNNNGKRQKEKKGNVNKEKRNLMGNKTNGNPDNVGK